MIETYWHWRQNWIGKINTPTWLILNYFPQFTIELTLLSIKLCNFRGYDPWTWLKPKYPNNTVIIIIIVLQLLLSCYNKLKTCSKVNDINCKHGLLQITTVMPIFIRAANIVKNWIQNFILLPEYPTKIKYLASIGIC